MFVTGTHKEKNPLGGSVLGRSLLSPPVATDWSVVKTGGRNSIGKRSEIGGSVPCLRRLPNTRISRLTVGVASWRTLTAKLVLSAEHRLNGLSFNEIKWKNSPVGRKPQSKNKERTLLTKRTFWEHGDKWLTGLGCNLTRLKLRFSSD